MTHKYIKNTLKETSHYFFRFVDFYKPFSSVDIYISINNKWLKRHIKYWLDNTLSMNIDNDNSFYMLFSNPKAINISNLFL